MEAGTGTFPLSEFKLNNMSYIKLLDKAGNVSACEGSDTELMLERDFILICVPYFAPAGDMIRRREGEEHEDIHMRR